MGKNVNASKNRKSEAQEIFDEADNAGRFAGDNQDSREARDRANENLKEETGSTNNNSNSDTENTDADARRDWAQTHNTKGEAQNVNDDTGRPLNEDEAEKASNKSNEGLRQGRNRS